MGCVNKMQHTVIVALSLNGCVFKDRGHRILAFIPPFFARKYSFPATLYDALGDAVTWARAAWEVVAGPWVEKLVGPGWTADLGLMWDAETCL